VLLQWFQKWGISFDDVMPLESIRERALGKVKNFARHRLESPANTPRIKIPPQKPGNRIEVAEEMRLTVFMKSSYGVNAHRRLEKIMDF